MTDSGSVRTESQRVRRSELADHLLMLVSSVFPRRFQQIINADAQRTKRATRAPSPEARPRLAAPACAAAAMQPGTTADADPQHITLADIERMEIDGDAKIWLEFLHTLQRTA